MLKSIPIALAFVLAGFCTGTWANPIVLEPVSLGSFSHRNEGYDGPYSELNHSRALGSLSWATSFSSSRLDTGYAIFDLNGVFGDVASADLTLELGSPTDLPTGGSYSLAISLNSGYFSTSDLLTMPNHHYLVREDLIWYEMLGDSAGHQVILPGFERDEFITGLNEVALSEIARRGRLTLHYSWYSSIGISPANSSADILSTPTLRLSGNNIRFVTTPGTMALLWPALLLLITRRRMTRYPFEFGTSRFKALFPCGNHTS